METADCAAEINEEKLIQTHKGKKKYVILDSMLNDIHQLHCLNFLVWEISLSQNNLI